MLESWLEESGIRPQYGQAGSFFLGTRSRSRPTYKLERVRERSKTEKEIDQTYFGGLLAKLIPVSMFVFRPLMHSSMSFFS